MEDNNGQEGQHAEAGAEEQSQPDPVRNMKAEMDRKFGNIQDQLAQIAQAMAQKQQPPAPKAEEIDPFVDPAGYKQRLKDEVLGEVTKQNQLTQATQSTIMAVQSQYPEFSQDNSDAAKLALQKFQQLPAHLRGTPEGAKMVMLEAASELGLVPASKRKRAEADDDAFSLGSGNSSGGRRERKPAKVDETTLAFAQLIGLDVNNPETRKSLEERAKRDSWSKYR